MRTTRRQAGAREDAIGIGHQALSQLDAGLSRRVHFGYSRRQWDIHRYLACRKKWRAVWAIEKFHRLRTRTLSVNLQSPEQLPPRCFSTAGEDPRICQAARSNDTRQCPLSHFRGRPHLFPTPNAGSCQGLMCGASILKNRTRNFRPLNTMKANGRAPKRRGRPNPQAPLSERFLHPFGRERCMANPHAGELHHRT